jgi:hypothetical protein
LKIQSGLLVAIVSASLASAQSLLSSELNKDYLQIKELVTKAADAMPEVDYGFKPAPGSRTFGAAVVHVAFAQALLCGIASGTEPPSYDESKSTKAEAQAALKGAFALCDAVYATSSDADATKILKQRGQDRTKFGVLNSAVAHDNEMYGTLAVYLRLKGLTPPSSARGTKK